GLARSFLASVATFRAARILRRKIRQTEATGIPIAAAAAPSIELMILEARRGAPAAIFKVLLVVSLRDVPAMWPRLCRGYLCKGQCNEQCKSAGNRDDPCSTHIAPSNQ